MAHDSDRPPARNRRQAEGVATCTWPSGRPPTLRLHGHLRELQTKVLEAEDTMALMKSITPERIQQEFEETGSGDFGFAYGDGGALPRRRSSSRRGTCAHGAAADPQQAPDLRADRPARDGRADLPPPARALPRDRADRLGQDDDAGDA